MRSDRQPSGHPNLTGDANARIARLVARRLDGQPVTMRLGTITAFGGGDVTVSVAGASIVIDRLADYTPAVGHTVLVAFFGSSAVVLGRIF